MKTCSLKSRSSLPLCEKLSKHWQENPNNRWGFISRFWTWPPFGDFHKSPPWRLIFYSLVVTNTTSTVSPAIFSTLVRGHSSITQLVDGGGSGDDLGLYGRRHRGGKANDKCICVSVKRFKQNSTFSRHHLKFFDVWPWWIERDIFFCESWIIYVWDFINMKVVPSNHGL